MVRSATATTRPRYLPLTQQLTLFLSREEADAVYSSAMSPVAPPTVAPTPEPRWPGRFPRTRGFWRRVSEGSDLDDLWSQFTADARASYGFYGKDVNWEEGEALPHWPRPLFIAKQFFWALMMKLSPARRVLLLVALTLFLLSSLGVRFGDFFVFDAKFEW